MRQILNSYKIKYFKILQVLKDFDMRKTGDKELNPT